MGVHAGESEWNFVASFWLTMVRIPHDGFLNRIGPIMHRHSTNIEADLVPAQRNFQLRVRFYSDLHFNIEM